jgi:60 kDa SS-A/Ro ribonucleoprotein
MSTPQSSAIPGSTQVENNAGGYTWKVDDMIRLRRFVCLGSEKGNYYTKEPQLTLDNAQAIARLLAAGRGPEVVKELIDYSVNGRTAKQDPILFALAMCVRCGDVKTKTAAYEAVGKICRIPTFLFTFIQFVEAMTPNSTGWGRGMRGSIQEWYTGKEAKELAFTVTKYKQRNGWSHRDLLRLAHVKPSDDGHQLVFKYVTKGAGILEGYEESEPKKVETEAGFDLCDHPAPVENNVKETLELLRTIEAVGKLTGESERFEEIACEAIKRFHLAREHLPTQLLNSVGVWSALLEDMPMTAMIRNLAKMTSIGLLQDGNAHMKKVVEKVTNVEQLKKARIHPFNVLVAGKVYAQGRGEKGSLTWNPLRAVGEALDKAFYLSFKNVEPTGQSVVVGLDVSGSMSCNVLGSESISCREAAMAMSLVMARTEPACKMMAFNGELVPLKGVSPQNTLEQNLAATSGLPFGSTDCALPMIWATKNKVEADVFIVYTDNETWAGEIHPSQALVEYRRKMKKPHAKLIVVGMAVNEFSIADPEDRGMLDIAGFDSAAPEIMRNFMLGLI